MGRKAFSGLNRLSKESTMRTCCRKDSQDDDDDGGGGSEWYFNIDLYLYKHRLFIEFSLLFSVTSLGESLKALAVDVDGYIPLKSPIFSSLCVCI